VGDEIREEIAFHLDEREHELEARGFSPADARREARRRFGNPAVVRDRGYDVRGGGFMEAVMQDVRYAIRLLVRQRGFSLVALLTLALGIGATTAIFCVVDAALIRPLPYQKPEQLVDLTLVRDGKSGFAPSLADMEQWRSLTQIFRYVGSDR